MLKEYNAYIRSVNDESRKSMANQKLEILLESCLYLQQASLVLWAPIILDKYLRRRWRGFNFEFWNQSKPTLSLGSFSNCFVTALSNPYKQEFVPMWGEKNINKGWRSQRERRGGRRDLPLPLVISSFSFIIIIISSNYHLLLFPCYQTFWWESNLLVQLCIIQISSSCKPLLHAVPPDGRWDWTKRTCRFQIE